MIWPYVVLAISLLYLLIHFVSGSQQANSPVHIQPSGVLGTKNHLESFEETKAMLSLL
jgi:hypothetical protein